MQSSTFSYTIDHCTTTLRSHVQDFLTSPSHVCVEDESSFNCTCRTIEATPYKVCNNNNFPWIPPFTCRSFAPSGELVGSANGRSGLLKDMRGHGLDRWWLRIEAEEFHTHNASENGEWTSGLGRGDVDPCLFFPPILPCRGTVLASLMLCVRCS